MFEDVVPRWRVIRDRILVFAAGDPSPDVLRKANELARKVEQVLDFEAWSATHDPSIVFDNHYEAERLCEELLVAIREPAAG